MTTSPAGRRLFALLNLAVLTAAWIGLERSIDSRSLQHKAMLGAGLAALAAAGVLTLSRASWIWWVRRRTRVTGTGLRAVVSLTPWFSLVGLVVLRGLWWTQRPAGLRFFLVDVLLNWSLAWHVGAGPDAPPRDERARPATLVAAIVLFGLGFQGLALGLTPFGCGMSAMILTVGAGALALAFDGTRAGRLHFLTAAGATALAFALIEMGVRVLHVGVNLQERDSREVARQYYTLTPPGAAFVYQPTPLDEFPPALVEINSLGIRGPELPDPHADVLLIGDSFIEARQLAWKLTVGARLPDALRQRSLPRRVVAHGVRGWSPLLEWNWYLKMGRTLKPRLVLLFFFWNDLWPEGSEVRTFHAVLDARGRPSYFDVPVESGWIWYQHARSLRLLDGAWEQLSLAGLKRSFTAIAERTRASQATDEAALERAAEREAGAAPLTGDEVRRLLTEPAGDLDPALRAVARSRFWPGIRPLTLWTDAQRAAAAGTERELRAFADDVQSDGGRLVIVYVPNPLQIGARECSIGRFFDRVDRGVVLPPESGVQTWLRGVSDRQGIEFLDPSRAMREADASEPSAPPLYLRADCHWSAAGHQFMADYLADWYARGRARGAAPR